MGGTGEPDFRFLVLKVDGPSECMPAFYAPVLLNLRRGHGNTHKLPRHNRPSFIIHTHR